LSITIRIRNRAAALALITTVGLTALKLTAALFSNSVGLLSEGIHSFLDLISASLSVFTVREAGKPADVGHPFGHGKIETLSSLFEALLLALAALLIIWEGIDHLQHPTPIRHEGLALLVIFISLVVSYFMYRHNTSAANATDSSALRVNALHFLSDVVASFGVFVGLALMKITGWTIIDPIVAFGVAIYILMISAVQVKSALLELADTQLPYHEIEQIQALLAQFKDRTIEAHDLRTRKSGATRHIDFHLVVCSLLTVETSHSICDEIETKLLLLFPSASVTIHVEPCRFVETAVIRKDIHCPEGGTKCLHLG
jgi:cation diffusion facilitator family transporter